VLVEPHRILDADDSRVANASHQQPVELVNAREVPGAYGGHLDDLPFDELHPVVLVQYPGLAHAVVVVNGEAPPYNLLRHRSPPVVCLDLARSIPEVQDSSPSERGLRSHRYGAYPPRLWLGR
jgi:hypothetical protein